MTAIPSLTPPAMIGSKYGRAQPPCSKPPRVSSSGRPGACITPSSVKLRFATTLLKYTACLAPGRGCYYQKISGSRQVPYSPFMSSTISPTVA